MRITSKGQVTIPVRIRKQAGMLPNTEVEFDMVGRMVRLRKVRGPQPRGRRLVERLRGRGSVRMTTDEILALTRG
jgi:AbrB family looped-hinge helix DNA binding protein